MLIIRNIQILVLILVLSALSISCSNAQKSNEHRRAEMVRTQIKGRGIVSKPLLKAFEAVPREAFVLPRFIDSAYDDNEVPFGRGQTIDRAYEAAVIVDAVELQPSDRVLHVGTGSGYMPAIISHMAKDVYTVEIVPEISVEAQQRISKLKYDNIHFRIGDGFIGWKEHGPFDAMIFACSPSVIPAPIIEQLAEGGRLLLPLGGNERFQELVLYTKKDGKIVEVRKIAPTTFTPMKGKILEQ
jgi:protein-L-isoaspartate(D-aspartate) O-methyltransferase